jgi:gentisate 1,2-dioxygenase
MNEIRPVSFESNDIIYSKKLIPKDHNTTSPTLNAWFLKIKNGRDAYINEVCTSRVFYVIHGSGFLRSSHLNILWNFDKNDVMVVYGGFSCTISTDSECLLYYINDEPLMSYLGVLPIKQTFESTHFSSTILEKRLFEVMQEKNIKDKNRCGILLANLNTLNTTKTLTPIMWSLLNILPAHSSQRPHRHNSVALDLCVRGGQTGVYTLMGKSLNEDGWIKDPIKMEWKDRCVFITPPGWWHSHHNDTDTDAVVFPVQDAGLFLYQRILDIQFST